MGVDPKYSQRINIYNGLILNADPLFCGDLNQRSIEYMI